MTAVASPPSFQHNNRSAWGSSAGQGGLNPMNSNEVARMFMPRKSAQRANSSSSISSNSSMSSTATVPAVSSPQINGTPMPATGDMAPWGSAAARKKPQRAGPWPANKPEPASGVGTARPQSILATNGSPATPSAASTHLQSSILPSQHILQSPASQTNGIRPAAQSSGDGNPVLYLLSMNGTFERKTITVPYYPDSLRIGRQTNGKTVPTPANGYFDSKVLSRQHAEVWADRNGKVWIRDVKSSNGTFVNGARLSPENRDSEPHELQTQDHLELGIDIVSDDQKTVVHHKVAAKVEHAGYSGATNNVLDMNFGDLDPANGAMMVHSQGALQLRGRAGSQGSVGSNSRLGPPTSVAGSQMSIMGQQRPMNFWLTPVTTEHIVKRLTSEMRAARLQTSDLGRADLFFGALLSKENVKDAEKLPAIEAFKPQINGGSLSLKTDAKSRFSEPPAPPPQQPLPEKPDAPRSSPSDPSPPPLKRANTERPRSGTTSSPISEESTSQILSLVEALASAKKEISSQSARMRDLELMLQKERQARELAEQLAKQLELQSSRASINHHDESRAGESIVEEAFGPSTDRIETKPTVLGQRSKSPTLNHEFPTTDDQEQNTSIGKDVDTGAISTSTSVLEQRMETMLIEMQQLKEHLELFKKRAETAEAERDVNRKTLAEMVEKIRSKDPARGSSSPESAPLPAGDMAQDLPSNSSGTINDVLGLMLEKPGPAKENTAAEKAKAIKTTAGTLTVPPGAQDDRLYQVTPYASMLGVVLIGMGLMAYLNGWQSPKVD